MSIISGNATATKQSSASGLQSNTPNQSGGKLIQNGALAKKNGSPLKDRFGEEAKNLSKATVKQFAKETEKPSPKGGKTGGTHHKGQPKETFWSVAHLVQPKETYWSIAKDQLGPGASDKDVTEHVKKLMELNPGIEPNSIKSGQTINTTAPGSIMEVSPATRTRYDTSTEKIPYEIRLPKIVNSEMQKAYARSFPGGKSLEQGGTIVKDAKGKVSVVNQKTGIATKGSFIHDRKVAPGVKLTGTIHSHPYDKSEGSHKGVSFSGSDIGYANHYNEEVYVDSGTKQFMIKPTSKTPKVTDTKLKSEWNSEYNSQRGKGKAVPEASAAATKKIANKYGMAYYEGADGVLKRIIH